MFDLMKLDPVMSAPEGGALILQKSCGCGESHGAGAGGDCLCGSATGNGKGEKKHSIFGIF